MAQVTGAYKYASSPTVYGTVNGQQYAFSNANDFLGLGGSWNDVRTVDGPANPNANIPIYKAQSQPTQSNYLFPSTPLQTAQAFGSSGSVAPNFNTVSTQNNSYTNLNGATYDQTGAPTNQAAKNQYAQSQQPAQMQTATQNLQPANLGTLPSVTTNPAPSLQASIPGSTTPSTSLGNGATSSSINSAMFENQNNTDTIFSNLTNLFNQQQQASANIQSAGTVGPQELAAQQQVAQAQLGVGQAQQNLQEAQGQAQGFINPTGQPMDLSALTGQGALKQFNAQQGLISAQLQQQLAQTNLAYQQGNRQVAFNTATQVFNATRNNLQDMVTLYQASAPKNISTNYNPLTGAVNTTMINPLTGETYIVSNGNIGASTPLQNVTTQVNPLNGQLTTTGTNAAGQPVSYSMDSNGTITSSGPSNPGASNALVSSNINPQAVVGGYDLTSYAGASSATGNYGPTVNSIYSKIPTISNANDAQAYINSVNKNSPITGQMVMNAAAQYGVDPKVMMAVMQEESSMGTAGMATSTFNPGNVGNNSDTGKKTNWGSWQNGVNAVAQNLSKRQVNSTTNPATLIQNGASPQQVIQQVVGSLPQSLQNAVKYLPDGTPYLDGNQVTSSQIPMAQNASSMGIPYVNPDNASKLNTITATQKNLQDFQTLADAALSKTGWGANLLNYAGLIAGNIAGGTKLNDFNSYRSSAINAIQSLAGGNGFRLTQGEINVATDNLPTPFDTKAQADQKIKDLNAQLNSWIGTIIPGWQSP